MFTRSQPALWFMRRQCVLARPERHQQSGKLRRDYTQPNFMRKPHSIKTRRNLGEHAGCTWGNSAFWVAIGRPCRRALGRGGRWAPRAGLRMRCCPCAAGQCWSPSATPLTCTTSRCATGRCAVRRFLWRVSICLRLVRLSADKSVPSCNSRRCQHFAASRSTVLQSVMQLLLMTFCSYTTTIGSLIVNWCWLARATMRLHFDDLERSAVS